jgi:hypothetical protein
LETAATAFRLSPDDHSAPAMLAAAARANDDEVFTQAKAFIRAL